jgi:hypothetical protein
MQALIDYDGWRKWKDFSPPVVSKTPATKEHSSLNELKAIQKTGNASPASSKTAASREQSPVTQRGSSGLPNGAVGKTPKKGPPRRGNSATLASVDGADEED